MNFSQLIELAKVGLELELGTPAGYINMIGGFLLVGMTLALAIGRFLSWVMDLIERYIAYRYGQTYEPLRPVKRLSYVITTAIYFLICTSLLLAIPSLLVGS